jgi:hypothetical protein
MRYSTMNGLFVLCLLAFSAHAQQPPVGAQVTASEAGKAGVAQTIKAAAAVTAVDKASRTITLKSADGRSFDVVAGDEVKNFDQIKAGDQVVVQYVRALTMEVKKASGAAKRTDKADAVVAKPGDKPGVAAGRQVTVTTDVIAVDPKKSTITLKGPKGRVVVLNVANPDHFKVVKKGDQVEAVYTEAVAVTVEPAKKK